MQFDRLCHVFDLSIFERNLLLLRTDRANASTRYLLSTHWEQVLSEQQHPGPEVLAQISAQFNLSASQIQQIAQTFKLPADSDQTTSDAVSLWQHCRQQLRRNVEGLVQVIEPRAN
jgi:hypothetical protein